MTGEESAVILIKTLETMGVPYMLAGSFSSNFYGISRSTQDADFVIESRGVTLAGLQQRLGPAFVVDPQMSFETATGTELPHPDNRVPVSKAICATEGAEAVRGTARPQAAGILISKVFLSGIGQGCVLSVRRIEVKPASVCRLLCCGFSKVGSLSYRLVGIEFPSFSARSSHAFGQLLHRRFL